MMKRWVLWLICLTLIPISFTQMAWCGGTIHFWEISQYGHPLHDCPSGEGTELTAVSTSIIPIILQNGSLQQVGLLVSFVTICRLQPQPCNLTPPTPPPKYT